MDSVEAKRKLDQTEEHLSKTKIEQGNWEIIELLSKTIASLHLPGLQATVKAIKVSWSIKVLKIKRPQ